MVSYWPKKGGVWFPSHAHTQIHTVDHIYRYPPALEVSHHVSALRNLGGSIEAHVGVLTINHVLLERQDKIMQKTDERDEYMVSKDSNISNAIAKLSYTIGEYVRVSADQRNYSFLFFLTALIKKRIQSCM